MALSASEVMDEILGRKLHQKQTASKGTASSVMDTVLAKKGIGGPEPAKPSWVGKFTPIEKSPSAQTIGSPSKPIPFDWKVVENAVEVRELPGQRPGTVAPVARYTVKGQPPIYMVSKASGPRPTLSPKEQVMTTVPKEGVAWMPPGWSPGGGFVPNVQPAKGSPLAQLVGAVGIAAREAGRVPREVLPIAGIPPIGTPFGDVMAREGAGVSPTGETVARVAGGLAGQAPLIMAGGGVLGGIGKGVSAALGGTKAARAIEGITRFIGKRPAYQRRLATILQQSGQEGGFGTLYVAGLAKLQGATDQEAIERGIKEGAVWALFPVGRAIIARRLPEKAGIGPSVRPKVGEFAEDYVSRQPFTYRQAPEYRAEEGLPTGAVGGYIPEELQTMPPAPPPPPVPWQMKLERETGARVVQTKKGRWIVRNPGFQEVTVGSKSEAIATARKQVSEAEKARVRQGQAAEASARDAVRLQHVQQVTGARFEPTEAGWIVHTKDGQAVRAVSLEDAVVAAERSVGLEQVPPEQAAGFREPRLKPARVRRPTTPPRPPSGPDDGGGPGLIVPPSPAPVAPRPTPRVIIKPPRPEPEVVTGGTQAGKQPWEMTREEYQAELDALPEQPASGKPWKGEHHILVDEAVDRGDLVPARVLAQYPDIVARYAHRANPPPVAAGEAKAEGKVEQVTPASQQPQVQGEAGKSAGEVRAQKVADEQARQKTWEEERAEEIAKYPVIEFGVGKPGHLKQFTRGQAAREALFTKPPIADIPQPYGHDLPVFMYKGKPVVLGSESGYSPYMTPMRQVLPEEMGLLRWRKSQAALKAAKELGIPTKVEETPGFAQKSQWAQATGLRRMPKATREVVTPEPEPTSLPVTMVDKTSEFQPVVAAGPGGMIEANAKKVKGGWRTDKGVELQEGAWDVRPGKLTELQSGLNLRKAAQTVKKALILPTAGDQRTGIHRAVEAGDNWTHRADLESRLMQERLNPLERQLREAGVNPNEAQREIEEAGTYQSTQATTPRQRSLLNAYRHAIDNEKRRIIDVMKREGVLEDIADTEGFDAAGMLDPRYMPGRYAKETRLVGESITPGARGTGETETFRRGKTWPTIGVAQERLAEFQQSMMEKALTAEKVRGMTSEELASVGLPEDSAHLANLVLTDSPLSRLQALQDEAYAAIGRKTIVDGLVEGHRTKSLRVLSKTPVPGDPAGPWSELNKTDPALMRWIPENLKGEEGVVYIHPEVASLLRRLKSQPAAFPEIVQDFQGLVSAGIFMNPFIHAPNLLSTVIFRHLPWNFVKNFRAAQRMWRSQSELLTEMAMNGVEFHTAEASLRAEYLGEAKTRLGEQRLLRRISRKVSQFTFEPIGIPAQIMIYVAEKAKAIKAGFSPEQAARMAGRFVNEATGSMTKIMTSAGTQKFQKFLLARRWAPTKIRQFLQVLTRAKYSERLFPGYVQAERGWMQNRMRVQVAKMVAGSLLVSEVTNYALSRGKRHCWDNGFEHIFDVYLGQDDKGQPRFASAFVGRQAEEMRKLLGIGVSGVRAFFEEGGGLQDRTKTGVEALGGEGLKYLWGKVHPVPRGAAQEAVEAVWTKKINLNRIMRNILPAGVSQVERVVGGKFTISEGLQSWLGAWPTKGQAVGAGEIRVETQRHNRAMQFVKDHYGKANKLNGSAVKWNEIDWSKMPRNAATEKAVKTVIESNERIAMERERRAFAIQYKLEDREVPRKPFASEAEMIRFLKAHGRKP